MPEDGSPPQRRGRPSRPEPAEPVGFRVTQRMRDELLLVQALQRKRSLQQLLEDIVGSHLATLRRDPLYAPAFEVLDATGRQPDLPANVRPMKRQR